MDEMYPVLILLTATTSIATCMLTSSYSQDRVDDVSNKKAYYANFRKELNYNYHRDQQYKLQNEGECPTWMYHTNKSSQCICGVDNYRTVKCDQSTKRAYIIDTYIMTYDEINQEVVVGPSLYGTYTPNDNYNIYHLVPMNISELNEAMCGHFNRKGRLCSECKEGYSPLVYSYNARCKLCSDTQSRHNILKFIGVAFVPLTLFYFIVVVFKFNANSPQFHGFLLFAHLSSASSILRVFILVATSKRASIGIKVLATLYGFWNLDFFRTLYPDICLKITALQALTLDYVIAFYPLLLILITLAAFKLHSYGYQIVSLMWYPFAKCISIFKKDLSEKTSMIDVFATFLLLSYSRILSVSFSLFIYISVVNVRGEVVGRYLYYDPSYEFLGKEHLPYGILALIIFSCFNILPLLLLLFYPLKWFQKCLNCLRLSHVALHTFVDSFAGCYKDGTEPKTRDCRYFAAFYLLIRILFHIIFEATLNDLFYGLGGIIATGLLILHALFQPYKTKYAVYNKISITMIAMMVIALFSALNVSIASSKMHQARPVSIFLFGIVTTVPLIYITIVAVRWTGVCKCVKSYLLTSMRINSYPLNTDDLSEESLLVSSSRENNNKPMYNSVSQN